MNHIQNRYNFFTHLSHEGEDVNEDVELAQSTIKKSQIGFFARGWGERFQNCALSPAI